MPNSNSYLLDTNIASALCAPSHKKNQELAKKLITHFDRVAPRLLLSQLVDYEVRRGLMHKNATKGLQRLDSLVSTMELLIVTKEHWDKAAELWVKARKMGRPTAGDNSMDADCILAAQAFVEHAIVITQNTRHFDHLVECTRWEDLQ